MTLRTGKVVGAAVFDAAGAQVGTQVDASNLAVTDNGDGTVSLDGADANLSVRIKTGAVSGTVQGERIHRSLICSTDGHPPARP